MEKPVCYTIKQIQLYESGYWIPVSCPTIVTSTQLENWQAHCIIYCSSYITIYGNRVLHLSFEETSDIWGCVSGFKKPTFQAGEPAPIFTSKDTISEPAIPTIPVHPTYPAHEALTQNEIRTLKSWIACIHKTRS